MDRRTFCASVGTLGTSALFSASGGLGALAVLAPQGPGRLPLRRIPDVAGGRLTLTARPTRADVGLGMVDVFTLNGSLPSPTIRLREGESACIDLVNELPEPTILHWHGLAVPEAADGHPRLAIPPGATYRYEFAVEQRPGTYWYHPHTHMRTAAQTYRGMGGLLIVEGDDEAALDLPSGEHQIPLLLQDKRLSSTPSLEYPGMGMGPDMMLGYLGNTAFANGVANPTLEVERTRYRLRILNGSTARIFDLALSNGAPLVLIGADGGLLEAPTPLERITLAPAERIDVLVDFSTSTPGERIILRSSAFEIPGMMMGMGGMGMGRGMRGRMGRGVGAVPLPQGAAMDLLELVVTDSIAAAVPPLPSRLTAVPKLEVASGARRRSFRFESMMMRHTINGRSFALDRVDERVPIGETEVWTFSNASGLPHPVHAHGGQFQVLSRAGGRARRMPWETGLKDTVLVLPGESVDVAVRFVFPGLFLLHCHNLEHEDGGMMANFEVVD
jgi:FtsP/CotA-like multicopper oxidase with cupredoxin domain